MLKVISLCIVIETQSVLIYLIYEKVVMIQRLSLPMNVCRTSGTESLKQRR